MLTQEYWCVLCTSTCVVLEQPINLKGLANTPKNVCVLFFFRNAAHHNPQLGICELWAAAKHVRWRREGALIMNDTKALQCTTHSHFCSAYLWTQPDQWRFKCHSMVPRDIYSATESSWSGGSSFTPWYPAISVQLLDQNGVKGQVLLYGPQSYLFSYWINIEWRFKCFCIVPSDINSATE